MSGKSDGDALERCARFLAQAPVAGWLKRDGRYLYVNPPWQERFGHRGESVVGRSDEALWPPDIAGSILANDRRALSRGRAVDDVERVTHADGTPREWLVVRLPYEDEDGPFLCGFAVDATERQRAERSLRAREAQLAEAQRVGSIGSWTFSPGPQENGGPAPVSWSDEMYHLLGVEVGTEPLLDAYFAVIHPDDRERVRIEQESMLSSGPSRFDQEHRILRSGEVRHVHLVGHVERAADGAALRVTGVIQDVTERRSAELAMRSSQAMLEAIHRAQTQFIGDPDPRASFDSLLDVLLSVTESEYGFVGEVLKDPEGRPYLRTLAITDISWNDETRQVYADNVVRGMEFRNLSTLFGRVMTSRQPVFANNPADHPARGGLPPGHPQMSAFLGLPLMYGEELVGMVGIANRPGGYTEELCRALEPFLTTSATMVNAHRVERRRQEAEDGLVVREEQLRTLVEQASDGIFVTDRTGRTLDVNGVGARILGRPRDEVIGLPLAEVLDPIEHPRLGPELARLDGGETVVGEWHFVRKDRSTFTGEVSAKRLSDGRLQRIVRDVSDRKRAEVAKQELEAQLRQSQKMEAVGTLAGGIAHDFNNILSAIVANTEMIELDPSSPSSRTSAREVLAACRRAKELVQRILAFGRRQDPSMRSIDLGPVVDEALQLLRSTIPAGVALQRFGAPSSPPVLADGSQVHQVVMNLVNNAWHALEGRSGWVGVGLTARTLGEDDTMPHPDVRPGEWVTLEISDNGRGMSPVTMERIFEPFFTTKDVGEGTGLGLSVVHGILQAHQGAITAESALGQGTMFRAWFPVSPGTLHPPVAAPKAQARNGSGQHVLFLDDEPALVSVTRRWFERFGYEVTSCTRADEALELFRSDPSRYDVVITDLSMPGMSGLELARELQALRPGVPIVLASGHLSPEQHLTARMIGLTLLPKPYTFDDICRCLPGYS